MSDPVTNAKIEDVLSAVRRLVSENAPADEPEVERGKLVLTPAFRVDTGPVAAPAPAEDAAEAAQPEEPAAGTTERESLEARIAELEAVVNEDESGDWEPDGSEEAGMPDEVVFHHVGTARPLEGALTEPEADPVPEAPMVDLTGIDDLAPDPDGVGEAIVVEIQEWEDADTFDSAFGGAEDLTEEGGSGENAIYDADTDLDDYAADAPLEDQDDLVIDEDVLREIVSRLVREELQGTMGERITRNLRRMVRREIARAMALKDFE